MDHDEPEHSKPASATIIEQQQKILGKLPFSDQQDFDNANKGFIARLKPNKVKNSDNEVVWNNERYRRLLDGDAPDTANPSLWRQSQLAAIDGLFEVVPGIYQVRGLDLSNTTFIEGTEGVIVIDPLTSEETGAAALALYHSYHPDRPVKAVIYTHSHVDHFGGVRGMIDETVDDVGPDGIRIFAPEGFLEHAVSENVFAGTAMGRRSGYMYGAALRRGRRSQIGAGLGQTVSTGVVTLIAPTDIISRTGHTETVDGVDMEFMMAPDTEAPSEMLIYFPQFRALCAAEDATHTFHNILTLRGAVVRDPHVWAKYLTETISLFGSRTDVVFASHHWPTWGADNVVGFLTLQRDLYAYVHDQTLRLLNQGFTGPEIAEKIVLPPALDQAWCARGYYGSLSHNVKAIYQRYMGWFDGNPAHLWEHTPVDRAGLYVDLAGGMGKLIAKGRAAFKKGDFRWAAEVLNHAVFAPDTAEGNDADRAEEARQLLADTYEQLGYGAENGPWRNFYLSGAEELRHGNFGTPTNTASKDILSQLSPEMVLDSIAIQMDGERACKESACMLIVLKGAAADYRAWLSNGAFINRRAKKDEDTDGVDVTLKMTAEQVPLLVTIGLDSAKLKDAGIDIDGDPSAIDRLGGLIDPGDPGFNIVTP